MRLRSVDVTLRNRVLRTSARLDSPALGLSGFDLWISLEGLGDGSERHNADPFFAFLLPLAMIVREPLEMDSPVSRQLLHSAPKIMDIYCRWWRAKMFPIEVAADARDDAPAEPGTGCFFSCGVDSFYTLLSHKDDITHLLTVHGFDVALNNQPLFAQLRSAVERVAQALGKTPVFASTNIRQISDSISLWGAEYHGAACGAVALATQGLLGRVFLASSFDYAALSPWGSHPDLDPLWSTGSIAFVHDGCSATRIEKARHISSCALALENLRVCWRHPELYNCGTCEKCVRTRLELFIAGSLARSKTLPPFIEPSMFDVMTASHPATLPFIEQLAATVRTSGATPDVIRAVDAALVRSRAACGVRD